jgi:Helix-turn-helix domain
MTLDDIRESTAAVLTVTQVTATLRDLDGNTLDERTVRHACETGQLPCVRIGKRILIPREAFLALFGATPDMSADPVVPTGPSTTTDPLEGPTKHDDTKQLRSA